MTRFSVVMPAYNSGAFIGEALEAICAQTLPAAEVIVIDDGSDDDTGSIIRRFSPRVTGIRIENGGQGAARRFAIERCSSPWIALCDSDDLWKPDHLARRVDLVRQFPAAAFTFSDCYSFGPESVQDHVLSSEAPPGWSAQWVDERRGDFYTLREPFRAFLEFNPAYPSGLAFRRDAYERMGGFLPKYSRWIGEDTEFVRRFLLLPDLVVAGDRCQTWGYRRHENNYSRTRWKNFYNKARILQEHIDAGIVPEVLRSEVRGEIERSLGEAFDIAAWDRSAEGVHETYAMLPAKEKGLKRRVKFALSWVLTRS